ncbi:LysR family transcriptional regulator [Aquincola sp. J276]|uniref:LysR family transcriptional regulator n=1 Tax=Aquincola sp. J276 TaxID=2898432 RepID=UPI002151412E|nr:LysR family transcriptional regulator [Aquincola sp. J276]MCR5865975.1 LysR family transcriptional regulator [Aquincola sp. J276]
MVTVTADSLELPALQLALRAAELGSVAAAARERDWLPATATAAIRRLEAQLGAALFTRNSRALRPTPEGAAFLQRAQEALALLGDGVAQLREPLAQVRGLLRLGMPSDLGARVLRPLLDDFLALHPALQLDLQVGDRVSDLSREPVDAALRYGEPQQPGLIVRRLADNHRVLVASPDYLARAGTPHMAEDIAQHDGISLRLANRPGHVWAMLDGGRPVSLRPRVRRTADSGLVTREWALAGQGIAMKSLLDVADDLAAGRLVQVLPQLRSAPYPLVLALASGSHLSARVRALGDFLQQRLAAR